MLFLSSISDVINITLAPAAALDVHVSFMDHAGTVVTPGRQDTKTTVEVTKNIVDAPAVNVIRSVKTIHVRNVSGGAVVVRVFHKDGVTDAQLIRVSLLDQWSLHFVEGVGFRVLDENGKAQG